MLVYIILTDLDYPDDEPGLYIRVDAITSFRGVQHQREPVNAPAFTNHFTVINLVGGTNHAVTETAEEVQSKMIEAMDKAYNLGDDDSAYTFAPSAPLELEDDTLAALRESLGFLAPDHQHTLAATDFPLNVEDWHGKATSE